MAGLFLRMHMMRISVMRMLSLHPTMTITTPPTLGSVTLPPIVGTQTLARLSRCHTIMSWWTALYGRSRHRL